ncbi:hypothetical protein EYF80_027945 [Liparis tanakae]|uniref:Uncharacterized protein n=1 Tax=Liparis tanakae TaxID=230148 RepID=A0A4Z2H7B9_9TELE|nr:hypothetical protein EYF80_027945 [Liparis tanakae]
MESCETSTIHQADGGREEEWAESQQGSGAAVILFILHAFSVLLFPCTARRPRIRLSIVGPAVSPLPYLLKMLPLLVSWADSRAQRRGLLPQSSNCLIPLVTAGILSCPNLLTNLVNSAQLTNQTKLSIVKNTSRAKGVGVSVPYILATETVFLTSILCPTSTKAQVGWKAPVPQAYSRRERASRSETQQPKRQQEVLGPDEEAASLFVQQQSAEAARTLQLEPPHAVELLQL